MGEIFKRPIAPKALEFTGERLTSDLAGETPIEHWHRYLVARDLAYGRDVLDIACGEGYGSALLAQTAASVVGVDLSETTVQHAARSYAADNLRYQVGDARHIPLNDKSVDLVVSFETLEHFTEHGIFLSEVRRVLRPGGSLLVSTPDRDIYSPSESPPNPYHKKELTQEEFKALLAAFFKRVIIQGQRVLLGSAIAGIDTSQEPPRCYERRGGEYFESSTGLARMRYAIALATDDDSAAIPPSFYVDTGRIGYVDGPALERLNEDLPSLRIAAARVPELEQTLAAAKADAAQVLTLRASVARIPELECALAAAQMDARELTSARRRADALEQGCRAAEEAAKVARACADAARNDVAAAAERVLRLEGALANAHLEAAEIPALRRQAELLEQDLQSVELVVQAGQARADALHHDLQVALDRGAALEQMLAEAQTDVAEVSVMRRQAEVLQRECLDERQAAMTARSDAEVLRRNLESAVVRIAALEQECLATGEAVIVARSDAEVLRQNLAVALERIPLFEKELAEAQAEVGEVSALRVRADALARESLAATEAMNAARADAEVMSRNLDVALKQIPPLERALAQAQAEAGEVTALRRQARALEIACISAEDAAGIARGMAEATRQDLFTARLQISELERAVVVAEQQIGAIPGLRAAAALVPGLEQSLAQAREEADEVPVLRRRAAALEQACQMAEAAARSARDTAEASTQDLRAASGEIAELQQALASLRLALEELPVLRCRVAALERSCAAAEHAALVARGKADLLSREQERASRAEAEVALLRDSTSWRITRPLRLIARIMRRDSPLLLRWTRATIG